MKKKFRSFNESKKFVLTLGLKTVKEWQKYCVSGNKPDNIPSIPNRTFKKDWTSWGDWLGTGTIATINFDYRSFNDARKFVQQLDLKRQKDWEDYCKSGKKPQDIPSNPHRTYKDEWKGIGDWLGTGRIATQDIVYRSFNDAKKFVQKLNLKSGSEWTIYCQSGKKPQNIPYNAKKVYKKEWKGTGDWLGTGTIATYNLTYRSFQDARKFSQQLSLNDNKSWTKYCNSGNKPDDIPSAPEHQYKNKGWVNWGDWLGTGRIANYNKTYRSFKEAKKFVQKLGLRNHEEWKTYCNSGNKPDDIPSAPWQVYNEWKKNK